VTRLAPSLALLLALGGAGLAVALPRLGPLALVPYVALWTAAAPLVIEPLGGAFLREWPGALFVLLTAASAEFLDDVMGAQQTFSLALVLLSFGYLAWRAPVTAEVLRDRRVQLLALFLAQTVASALVFGHDDLAHVVQNRISVLAAVGTGAVLVRRPDGERLMPVLLILGALLSVPVMLREVADPDLVLFSQISLKGRTYRAGGMFAQPNNVGMALSFAVAWAIVLRLRDQLGRGATWLILGAASLGILACASRGAMAVTLMLGSGWAWLHARRRAVRLPIATAILAGGVLCSVAPFVGQGAPRLEARLETLGFQNVERLGEVVSAVAGSPDELIDDDNRRLWLAEQALVMISERPLFGRGTGNFAIRGDLRSHNQFLEILGENGLFGMAFYVLFLITLVRSPLRDGAGLVLIAWLLHHVDNHNMLEYRFMVLPVAWLCGLTPAARRRDPAAPPR
jgi:O-antigen ligase